MNPARNHASLTYAAPHRLPAFVSLLLFAALCASIAYWVLQWLAPEPRPVAAPVASEQVMPPVAAAANLFGGKAGGGGLMNVQLRGIIHAGSAAGSVAIMSVDGSAPKYYRLNAELMPGVSVKAIHARTVVLSDHGSERELPLPAFAAQEGSAGGAPLRAMPEQNPSQGQPAPAAPAIQPQQQPVQPQSQVQGQQQGQIQGQLQGQMQGQPGALPPQASQGAVQAAGPSALGDTAAGAEAQQLQDSRMARNGRRPRNRDE